MNGGRTIDRSSKTTRYGTQRCGAASSIRATRSGLQWLQRSSTTFTAGGTSIHRFQAIRSHVDRAPNAHPQRRMIDARRRRISVDALIAAPYVGSAMPSSSGLDLRPEASKIHTEFVRLARWAENIGSQWRSGDHDHGAAERMMRQSMAATRGCIEAVESLLQWLETSAELQRVAGEADGLLALAWHSRWQLRADLVELLRVCDATVDRFAVDTAVVCWQRVLDESRSLAAALTRSAAARRAQARLAGIEHAGGPTGEGGRVPPPADASAPVAQRGPRR